MSYYVPKFTATGHWHTEWWSFSHLDRRREISFCHSAALIDPDGYVHCKSTVGYCNRTWECQRGLTARKALASLLQRKHGNLLATNPDVASLVQALMQSDHDVPPYSSAAGTQVGYSLSFFAPI